MAFDGDTEIARQADDVLWAPASPELLTPITVAIRCNCWPITSPICGPGDRPAAQPGKDRYGGVRPTGYRKAGPSRRGKVHKGPWIGQRRLLVNFVTNADRADVPLRRNADQGFQPPPTSETAEALFVRVEIAGMTPEAIDLTIDEEAGRLTISGNRPDPATRHSTALLQRRDRMRRVHQSRAASRPVVVDEVEASYDRGFLVVRLPIRAQGTSEPRNVPIR